MANFEIHKTNNYIVIGNYHLKDQKLSLKAKGLLSLMLSLPADWNYSIQGLINICIENETAIKTALGELKENGYLQIEKIMPDNTLSGKIEYVYHIYEKPQKQEGDFLGLENLAVENPTLNITNKDNTNKYISMKENTKRNEDYSSDLDFLSGIPTLQEVKDFVALKEFKFDAEDFYNYYSSIGWVQNNAPITNWQYKALQWGKRAEMKNGLKEIANKEQAKQATPIINRQYTDFEMDEIFKTTDISDDEI